MNLAEFMLDEDFGKVVLQEEDCQDTISESTGKESSGTCKISQEESNFEAPTNLTIKDRLVQVATVSYRDGSIKIFIDSLDPRRRFFFEPIVRLDRKHISVETCSDLFQQDVIRFTIQMWTQELLLKVLERLRSMSEFGDEKIQEDDISVLPFDQVHLVYKPGSIPESVKLFNQPISYLQVEKYLHFFLLTNSASAAHALYKNFLQNPEFFLKKWQLHLVGRGLALGEATKVASPDIRPVFSFSVTTNFHSPQFQGAALGVVPLPRTAIFNQQTGNVLGSDSSTNVVPVFSVKKCSNPQSTRPNGIVAFSAFNFVTKVEHGYFHLENGAFFVETPGIYQFDFNGVIIVDSPIHYARIDLKVNGVNKASIRTASSTEAMGYQPVKLSALLSLNSGEKVEISLLGGEIHEFPSYATQFQGFLFAN